MVYDTSVEKNLLEIIGNKEKIDTLNQLQKTGAVPYLLLCYARSKSLTPKQMEMLHLWKYVKGFYNELDSGTEREAPHPNDGTYRSRMIDLKKLDLVESVEIDPIKKDYVPTERGERVSEKLLNFLNEL